MQTHHSLPGKYYVWIFKGPSPELKINWTWGRRVLAHPLSIRKTATHIKRDRKCYLLSLLLFFSGEQKGFGVWEAVAIPQWEKVVLGLDFVPLCLGFKPSVQDRRGCPTLAHREGSNISLHGTKSKASLPLLTK